MAKLYGSVSGKSKEIKTLYGSVGGVSKELTKLYGSVNGKSKLIYEKSSGPTVPYGIVYYKATPSATMVQSVELQSVEEFERLGQDSSSWTASVGGGSVIVSSQDANCVYGIEIGSRITSVPKHFLRGCLHLGMPLNIPDKITEIGLSFLVDCSAFNQPITLSGNLVTIGNAFLNGCSSFNQRLVIPNSVTSIGAVFMYGCTSFNRPLILSSGLTSIGYMFLYNCKAMTSYVDIGSLADTILPAVIDYSNFATNDAAAACYATGIKIKGANRAAWMTRFPSITSPYYRKLLDYGS